MGGMTGQRIWRRALAAALAAGLFALAAAGGEAKIPLISDLVDGGEEAGGKEGGEGRKPTFPRDLSVEEANLEISDALPAAPYVYLESVNVTKASRALEGTAIARLLKEPRVEAFFKANPLTLENLFTDLPETYSSRAGVELSIAALRFARAFLDQPRRAAVAAYAGDDGGNGPTFVFLADIGPKRKEPFETLEALRDRFLVEYPNFLIDEAPRGDDYIDVLRDVDSGTELAFGILRNYVVLCSSASFAKRLEAHMAGKGDATPFSASQAYRDLYTRTAPDADLRGYADLASLLAETRRERLPGAAEALDFASDLLGRGVVYYDGSARDQRWIEHLSCPVKSDGKAAPGVPSRLPMVCKPAQAREPSEWLTTRLVPYQPEIFLALSAHQEALRGLLETGQPFGGSDYSMNLTLAIPAALRRLLTVDLRAVVARAFLNEAAFAYLGEQNERPAWMFAFRLNNPDEIQQLLSANPRERNLGGVLVYTGADEFESAEAWAVLHQKNHENLGGSFLLVASTGNLMQSLLDQITAASASLAINKDFVQQVEALGPEQSLIWYYNLPQAVVRTDLSSFVRDFFPRLKGVTQRPPSALLRKHLFGMAGGVAVRPGEETVRATLVSPMGVAPAMSLTLVLRTPLWIRQRARQNLSRSRANLGRMWLEMQTYATQRGHFPESLDELKHLLPEEERERIFVAEAAADLLGREAALQRSYRYVPGLRTTDEPDQPIVYEGGPWHYEYSGMFPPAGKEPVESGAYDRWRLVLQLDGTIRAFTEEEFKNKVAPRFEGRE